jgi:AcrR family transcriptional regulator
MTARIDRAAALRAAARSMVARHGFHGASVASIASEAGVAADTAYVHYASKDDLLIAAYVEAKRELGLAAVAGVDPDAPPAERFAAMWDRIAGWLDADRASFLVQFDAGPLAEIGHARAEADPDDPLTAAIAAPDLAALLVGLPPRVLFDLAVGPLVRAVAAQVSLAEPARLALRAACWRAITRTVPG